MPMLTLVIPSRETTDPVLDLAKKLCAVLDDTKPHHGDALSALAGLYRHILRRHPCCYQGGIDHLQQLADEMRLVMATQDQRPSTTH